MTEVVPRVFIGDINHAYSRKWLRDHKITHIVNAAVEIPNYHKDMCVYYNMNMVDYDRQSLSPQIQNAYRFMENAFKNTRDTRVLIHCHAGISRSSSTLIYFIMKMYNVPFVTACRYVKMKYPKANPNNGFVNQLMRL